MEQQKADFRGHSVKIGGGEILKCGEFCSEFYNFFVKTIPTIFGVKLNIIEISTNTIYSFLKDFI